MLGALISAGSSIIGGLMGKASADKARDAAIQQNYDNIQAQKEFAQAGIRWKVADAKAAGIHPLYALGASTPSFSPVSSNFTADTSMANAMAAAGQDIGRAINSTRTASERGNAFNEAVQKLSLEKMGLENQILRSDLASKNARLVQAANPPFPGSPYLIAGQTQSGVSSAPNDQPLKRTVSDPNVRSQEHGAVTDTGHLRTSGGLFPAPSDDAKQRIEDNFYQETMHFIRNNLLPMVSPRFNQPPYPAAKGKVWVYDPIYGYKQVRDTRLNRFFRYNFN